jgi:acetyltransferase-like isoleucine patch superfamily enzyme
MPAARLCRMIEIAPDAVVSARADIEDSVRGSRIVIGPRSVIDAFVKIKPAGGAGDIIIGADCVINAGCVLYSGHGIHIGDNVLIAANCTLAATGHAFADPHRPIRAQGFAPGRGGIVIEDDVWIGAGAILLDGARVGGGSVIGAGALVRGALPGFCVAHGRPARVQRWRQA